MTPAPIQTSYSGYRFRSRLEARWAVFFDVLGVRWEYEPEGYRLPSGWYLPDFFLPDLGWWVEVKREGGFTDHDQRLAGELAVGTGNPIFLAEGMPPAHGNIGSRYGAHVLFGGCDKELGGDNGQAFCVCDGCGSVGIRFEGRSDRLSCKECYQCGAARHGYGNRCADAVCQSACKRSRGLDRGHTHDHERILEAVAAARSARFEHGESPRVPR